jgi:hypothetical protein
LSLVVELSEFLNQLEIGVALLVYRFNIGPKQTAMSLGMKLEEFPVVHKNVLVKLMKRYKTVAEVLNRFKNRPL